MLTGVPGIFPQEPPQRILNNKRGLTIAGQPPCVMARSAGLEPAPSGVTGRRYNQLNYDPNNSILLSVQILCCHWHYFGPDGVQDFLFPW
jgi:hypothetical protein